MPHSNKAFPFAITGLASTIGNLLSIDEFAAQLQIPDRRHPGEVLSGSFLRELLGLESKSWDPKLFRKPATLVETAARAMRMAGLTASDVDALVIVTCTPLWVKLDQDAFALASALSLPSRVSVLQVHAGCAGLPRVLHWLADLPYRNVVTLFYNLASPMMIDEHGALRGSYLPTADHPRAARLWFSPALFADGASAAVWSRQRSPTGWVSYAREPGDPLIHHEAGGAHRPPAAEMVYEIATGPAAEYYREGMARNHAALEEMAPGWLAGVTAYYLHQTSAAAVREFYEQKAIPLAKQHLHADRYGNMSSPAALVMACEDHLAGKLAADATIAIAAVGAGPERGAALVSLRLGLAK